MTITLEAILIAFAGIIVILSYAVWDTRRELKASNKRIKKLEEELTCG